MEVKRTSWREVSELFGAPTSGRNGESALNETIPHTLMGSGNEQLRGVCGGATLREMSIAISSVSSPAGLEQDRMTLHMIPTRHYDEP